MREVSSGKVGIMAILDNYKCDGQLNLFGIDFESFAKKYCKHLQGYMSFGEEGKTYPACCYKNEHPARSWEDWQKCSYENCPFFNFGGEL